MGQVNVVRFGINHLRDSGSFTLTGGALAHEPMSGGAAISMVNAGLEGFVLGASVEMPRGLRVNLVSPPWISETLVALKMDPSIGISAAACAKAYVAAVEGKYQARRSTPGSSSDQRDGSVAVSPARWYIYASWGRPVGRRSRMERRARRQSRLASGASRCSFAARVASCSSSSATEARGASRARSGSRSYEVPAPR